MLTVIATYFMYANCISMLYMYVTSFESALKNAAFYDIAENKDIN